MVQKAMTVTGTSTTGDGCGCRLQTVEEVYRRTTRRSPTMENLGFSMVVQVELPEGGSGG